MSETKIYQLMQTLQLFPTLTWLSVCRYKLVLVAIIAMIAMTAMIKDTIMTESFGLDLGGITATGLMMSLHSGDGDKIITGVAPDVVGTVTVAGDTAEDTVEDIAEVGVEVDAEADSALEVDAEAADVALEADNELAVDAVAEAEAVVVVAEVDAVEAEDVAVN